MTALFTNRSLAGGIDQIPLPQQCPGELWLCGKHVIGVDVEATLAFTGADHVVCLTQRHELIDRYPAYVAWLDANQPARATSDLGTLSADESLQLYRALTNLVQAGSKLIVHCAAGIGRSGTAAVAILMLLGTEIGEAEDIVAAHRPMAGPETGPQRELLETLAQSIGPWPANQTRSSPGTHLEDRPRAGPQS
jgi:Protein-tyrosine phosphatase